MDESGLMQSLENEYCPPLDPALFAAIANDYNLGCDDSVRQLRHTLDALKVSAAEEEDLPFDPSGMSGRGPAEDVVSERSVSHKTLGSLETNLTGPESSVSSICLDQGGEREQFRAKSGSKSAGGFSPDHTQQLSAVWDLGLDGKTAYLMEMFPSLDRFTVTHTLKKCGEDVDRSMDVLLNLTFFDEEDPEDPDDKISVPMGIEGFVHSNPVGKGRNKKGRRRNNRGHAVGQSEPSSPLAGHPTRGVENKWDNGKKDVEFIRSRTYLSYQHLSSAYHLNGASVASTIRFLAAREADKHSENLMDDPVTASQVAELREEFSLVPAEKLVGLLRLARNSISAAHELASVMISEPEAPLSIDSTVQALKSPLPPDQHDVPARKPKPSTSTHWSAADHSASHASAVSHLVAGQDAFSKAGAAYRRGKSDRLMGGAAGYYSAVGREHMERAKRESMAAADALVNEQSTDTVLDLHGVSVQDAVRIADIRVANWWDSLGDTKYTYAAGGWNPAKEGYRIVTGLGRHSQNGKARLGPAVARMLTREGWKVEVGHGVLIVTGLARRR